MNVKRFVAADMRRALELVKQEMGDNAVILSSKRIKSGVEILTSNDTPFEEAKMASAAANSYSSYGAPSTNHSANNHSIKNSIADKLGLSKNAQMNGLLKQDSDDVALDSDDAWSWDNTMKPSVAAKQRGLASGKTQQELAAELDSARRKMEAADNVSFIQQEKALKDQSKLNVDKTPSSSSDSIQKNLEANRAVLEKELEQLKLKQQLLEQQQLQKQLEHAQQLEQQRQEEAIKEELNYQKQLQEQITVLEQQQLKDDKPTEIPVPATSDTVAEQPIVNQIQEDHSEEIKPSVDQSSDLEDITVPSPKFILFPDANSTVDEEEEVYDFDEVGIDEGEVDELDVDVALENNSRDTEEEVYADLESNVEAENEVTQSPFAMPNYVWTGPQTLSNFISYPNGDEQQAQIDSVVNQAAEIHSLQEVDEEMESSVEAYTEAPLELELNSPIETVAESSVESSAEQHSVIKNSIESKDEAVTNDHLAESEQFEIENIDDQWQEIKNEISDMREMLHIQLERLSSTETVSNNNNRPISLSVAIKATIKRRLVNLGLEEQTADKIVNPIKVKSGLPETWTEVLAKLAHEVPVWGQDIISRGGIYAFVGPSGAGKTSMISKIATRAVIEKGAKSLSIITLNPQPADKQQVERLGKILGVTVTAATDRVTITRALADQCNDHLILIDTTSIQDSRNISSKVESKNTVDILRRLPQVENILVLPATGQEKQLRSNIENLSVLQPIACVLSKVDECLSLGESLNVVMDKQLPIAYVSNGPKIPMNFDRARGHHLITRAVSLLKKDQTQQLKLNQFRKKPSRSSFQSGQVFSQQSMSA